ncbi:MAG: hypothetical protein AABN95_14870 [Acidobacteriota bacterium]
MKSQKRITALQVGQTAEGSRVSVFSDSALYDYEAFRRGDRFYVKLPLAEFAAAQPNFRGDGFEDVQVQRVGESLLISFKLNAGVMARVDQHSNRLDVIFSTPNKTSRNASGNATPSRTVSNVIPGIVMLQNARAQQRHPDAAGPMPPDSPRVNRPRVVTQEASAERQGRERISQRTYVPVSSGQEIKSKANNRVAPDFTPVKTNSGSDTNPWKATPRSDSPSTTPSATPTYPASTSVTESSSPLSSRPVVTSRAPTAPTGWKTRGELTLQWVSANRVAVSIGAFVLLSLILVACTMLYRKRRKQAKTQRAKVPGVQPKTSPEMGFEELLNNARSDSYEPILDDYATELTQPQSEVTSAAAARNVSQSGNGSRKRVVPVQEQARAQSAGAPVRLNQAFVSSTAASPNYTVKNEEPEREVFEL